MDNSVYPSLEESSRIPALWEAIFVATRANLNQPVESWRKHTDLLQSKAKRLNERKYKSLH